MRGGVESGRDWLEENWWFAKEKSRKDLEANGIIDHKCRASFIVIISVRGLLSFVPTLAKEFACSTPKTNMHKATHSTL